MFYAILLFAFLFGEIVTICYLLGRYTCLKNSIFGSNFFGKWMVGTIIYFCMTFIVFFGITFLTENLIYYIVVFFLKDFFIYLYLFLRRNNYLTVRENQMGNIASAVVASWILWLVYNYGVKNAVNLSDASDNLNFQNMWYIQNEIFQEVFVLKYQAWGQVLTQLVTTFVIYGTVMTLFYEISVYESKWKNIAGVGISVLSMFLFSFERDIQWNMFVYFTLLGLVLIIRFVIFERRRYAIIFSVASVSGFLMDNSALLTFFAVSFFAMIIYTVLQKPKASFFWITLMLPSIFLVFLNLLESYLVLSLFSVVFTGYLYISTINTGKTKIFNRLDRFLEKIRLLMLPFVVLLVFLLSFIQMGLSGYDSISLVVIQEPVWPVSDNNGVLVGIQSTVYACVVLTILYMNVKLWKGKEKRITTVNLVWILVGCFVAAFYNPVSNVVFTSKDLTNSFKLLKVVVYLPIIIVFFNWLINSLVKIQKQKTRKNRNKNLPQYYV